MEVYILEDNPYHQNRLEECLALLSTKLGIPLNVVASTGKPTELLSSIQAYGRDQIYFLDIELKNDEKRGLEVAQKIREKDDQATIIFVTTHSEFAAITYFYKVAALDFINKETETADFIKSIEKDLLHVIEKTRIEETEDFFELNFPQRRIKVPFREISYIETSPVPHKLVLITDRQRIEFYESMRNIEKIEPRFYRAHKAYLVNPYRVREINRTDNEIIFVNGGACLISRRKIKGLEDLMDHL